MAQTFYYEVRYLQGTKKKYMLQTVSGDGSKEQLLYNPDSEQWLALLAHQKSFHFEGQQGRFTARRETRQDKSGKVRGEAYWVAYRKVQKHQFKKYLGTNDKLSCAKLEEVAEDLEETIRQKLGISDNEVIPNFRQSRERRDQETIQHLRTHNKKLVDKNEKLEQTIREQKRTIERRDCLVSQEAARFNQIITEQDQRLKQREQTIAQRDQIINQQKQRLTEQEQIIKERTRTITEQEQTIAQQDHIIAEQEQITAEQDQIIDQQKQIIRKLQGQIQKPEQGLVVRYS